MRPVADPLVAIVLLAGSIPAAAAGQTPPDGDELVLSGPYRPNGGHAYVVALEVDWASDGPGSEASRLVLLEDGAPLGPPHASHQRIRDEGRGRYSHWEEWLYFSTSDNSDPNENGRRYAVRVDALPRGRAHHRVLPPRDPFVLLDRDALVTSVAGADPEAPPEAAESAPRLIYWYTIDALRTDTAVAQVDGRPLMPALAAFRAESVRFRTAYAHSSFTKVSTASMFTGLWPQRHGVMHGVVPTWPEGGDLVYDLDARFYTLAEYLRDRGYETITHPYTVHVRPGDGMLQGFLAWDLASSRPAPLERLPSRAFVYEHVLGVHGPYDPSTEAKRRLGLSPPRHVRPESTDWFSAELDERQAAELRDAYRAEAIDADRRLAERLAWIRSQGVWDEALIVVTSDHGEEFLEHGLTQHTAQLYEPVVHVPLLVKFPAGHRWAGWHGREVIHRVGLVDVYPTIVELVSGRPDDLPYPLDGGSLGAILDGREPNPLARDVFLRTTFNTAPPGAERALMVTDAVLSGRLKAVAGYRLKSSQAPRVRDFTVGEWFAELYDVTRDRGESSDLASRRPEELERLLAAIAGLMRPLGEGPGAPMDSEDIDPELLETLRALGYLR